MKSQFFVVLFEHFFSNFKRMAETWMDDYAKFVYRLQPDVWDAIDIGDISFMLNIKKKLKCRPFKYFLEEIAPDMLDRYPFIEPPAFASGAVSEIFMEIF